MQKHHLRRPNDQAFLGQTGLCTGYLLGTAVRIGIRPRNVRSSNASPEPVVPSVCRQDQSEHLLALAITFGDGAPSPIFLLGGAACLLRGLPGPAESPSLTKPNKAFLVVFWFGGGRSRDVERRAGDAGLLKWWFPDTTCLGLPVRTAAPARPPWHHPDRHIMAYMECLGWFFFACFRAVSGGPVSVEWVPLRCPWGRPW